MVANIIRVGLDARPLSTRISGVGRLIGETIKAFPHSDSYQFHLYSHLPIHPDHKSILNMQNVVWHSEGGFWRWKGGLYYNLYLPCRIRKDKLDLFWGSQQVLPPFLPKRLKAVLTYCDLVLYLYPETMRFLARVQQRLVQSYSVRRSSFILSISKQTSDDVCTKFHYPKEKSGVAYPGINQKEMIAALSHSPSKQVLDLEPDYLLSVSTIEPRKNYPFLLEVYRKYRKKDPHHYRHWVIVGKIGWESKEFIEELKQERSLYKDIHILDSISDVDLQHLYRRAGLFLFASKYEGFGIPMLEALFHRKYCIVSNIPTFKEIGEDSATYLQYQTDEDANVWAEEICKFFQSPKEAIADISDFTWETSAKKTEEVFQRALGNL
ncbi:MAG: glycosyltransferase family 1 protein [Leptospira sp.]|nr:glycosyltransferase family 1 protein [Leptospira sp.]